MATAFNNQTSNRMLRSREVVNLTGLSKTTIWRLETAGNFPSRKKLSVGRVGWDFMQVADWISSRSTIISSGSQKTN
jgi:predicted DNA-binding transcriptional regulator AlpA